MKAAWTIQRCVKKFLMKRNVRTMRSELVRKLDVERPAVQLKASSGTGLVRSSGLTETNESEGDASCGTTGKGSYFAKSKNSAFNIFNLRKKGLTDTNLRSVLNTQNLRK